MNKTTTRTSGLISGLRSSYSSGNSFNLSGRKKTDPVIANQTTNQVQDPQNKNLSQDEKLDTLDQVISQVEAQKVASTQVFAEDSLGAVAQVVPQVADSIPDPLNPTHPTSVGTVKKETHSIGTGVALESPAQIVEYPGGIQTVEQERTPEIAPEVESFLKQAQEQPDQLPQEIVIADNQEVSAVTHHPKQPVIVLPITPEEQKLGRKKSPKLSIRWLVEWSIKIMKKFTGEVIYREE